MKMQLLVLLMLALVACKGGDGGTGGPGGTGGIGGTGGTGGNGGDGGTGGNGGDGGNGNDGGGEHPANQEPTDITISGEVAVPNTNDARPYYLAIYHTDELGRPTGLPTCLFGILDTRLVGYGVTLSVVPGNILILRVSHECKPYEVIDNTLADLPPESKDRVEAYVQTSASIEYTVDINRETTVLVKDVLKDVSKGTPFSVAVDNHF